MSFNEVIMEGKVVRDPIFFIFNNKERLELIIETIDNQYTNSQGEKKDIKIKHKVIVYNNYYTINAKKEEICKNCLILLRGKLSYAIDSTGEIPGKYCILVSTNNHYLKITSNYFLMNKKSKIKNFIENV